MTLFQLEVFLTVVETKSFTKAGEQIGLSQSAVSQAVAALETDLNVKLLNRNRKGVSLTKVGERITGLIRELMAIKTKIINEAAGITELETGTIRIGGISSMSAKLLPGMIGSFKKRFPGIEVILYEGSFEELRNWLKLSVIDLAVVSENMQEFDFVPLVQDKMVIFLPENHPANGKASLELKTIAHEPFIMPKECDRVLRSIFNAQGCAPNIQFEVRDIATILAMVQEGVGNTILPEMAIPATLPKVSASYLNPQVYQNVGLAFRASRYTLPVVSAFIHEAQEFTKDLSLKLFNSYHSVIVKKENF
ncbi:LysR family transcriptional regulator [Fictibacillus sp. Mic-4]|uniref:LysR family transcriptional regulator n=1 Tax=Fictibacillus TaxID=1329200 RepID=UPI0003FAEFF4|nr:LysR family transcriptional regulator [Fictibacillus gelatini]